MISIIICSRSKQKLQEVSENIAATIGVVFEIIAIDNGQGQYSIFQAYNLGVARSKYDLLCFMHEDITVKTETWGVKLESIFRENEQLGLVGVAGSSYKTKMPSHWSFPDALNKTGYINIIQHYSNSTSIIHHFSNPKKEVLSEVVAVDGVWFCTRRKVFDKVSFDDKTFVNFHCYDVDFSLSVGQHYKVAVTFDILIEHFSEGSFNKIWLNETLKLHKKWQDKLPINLDKLSDREQYLEEKKALVCFVQKMIDNNYFDYNILNIIFSKKTLAQFGYIKIAELNYSTGKSIFKRLISLIINK